MGPQSVKWKPGNTHKFFIRYFRLVTRVSVPAGVEPTGEVFDPLPVCAFCHRNIFAMQQNAPTFIRKDFAGELFIAR
jgi:hypothetical protein